MIGALAVASERRDGFSDDQCVLLQRLADSLALAADRARLQASERERRGWLTFVAEAGDLLAHSLDQEMTMAITGQIVVPRLGHVVRGLPRRRARRAGAPAGLARGRAAGRRTCATPCSKVAAGRGRRPEDALLAGEMTTLRLLARGRGIGHLVLGRPAGSPLRDDVLLVTESIARRAALAIDNARAHGALLATGQALQASLLPPSLPDRAGPRGRRRLRGGGGGDRRRWRLLRHLPGRERHLVLRGRRRVRHRRRGRGGDRPGPAHHPVADAGRLPGRADARAAQRGDPRRGGAGPVPDAGVRDVPATRAAGCGSAW